jgi:protocatechuate 3,4-dioxygenase, alpha subunit
LSERLSNVPTASQTVGPFFSIGLCPRTMNQLVPSGQSANAQVITISGQVLDGDGKGVPDAILEIWRADENGKYSGLADSTADGEPDGFARIATNDDGNFEFRTTKPGTAKTDSGQTSAPHLVVLIFMRGLLRHLLTRIYFPLEPANATDPVLQLVSEERRHTLIAERAKGSESGLSWNVRLQGHAETVFFDA